MYFWKKNNYDYSDNKHYSDKHAYNEKYEKTNKWFNNNSDSCGKSIENKMTQMYCNNCGKRGHSFYKCKLPITSYGVIAFRHNPVTGNKEYLMICRKHTLGFIDFMRGKYVVYNKYYTKVV